MDAACAPAVRSQLMQVTTAVLALGERVAAGDASAMVQVEALAQLLDSPHRPAQAAPLTTNSGPPGLTECALGAAA